MPAYSILPYELVISGILAFKLVLRMRIDVLVDACVVVVVIEVIEVVSAVDELIEVVSLSGHEYSGHGHPLGQLAMHGHF